MYLMGGGMKNGTLNGHVLFKTPFIRNIKTSQTYYLTSVENSSEQDRMDLQKMENFLRLFT